MRSDAKLDSSSIIKEGLYTDFFSLKNSFEKFFYLGFQEGNECPEGEAGVSPGDTGEFQSQQCAWKPTILGIFLLLGTFLKNSQSDG